MGDAHTFDVDPFDILKSKIIEALKKNGIPSQVSEIEIIEPPELKGEHFATETVYAKIHFADPSVKNKNLFVKKFFSSPVHTQMVKEMKVMEKEVAFFREFLPFAQNFCCRFSGSEDLLHFFPKCFYGDDECVIMENLVLDSEFIMLERTEFQDFFTANVVLTNLAKFHAVNFALIEDMGREEFRKKFPLIIAESFDFSETSIMAPMFDNGIVIAMKILTDNPLPGSKETIEKLGALLGKILPEMAEIVQSNDAQPLLVLNHGDCWNNNMLFRKDAKTGLVSDHVFVDLQFTRYASPGADLGYYILTSIKPEIRRTRYQELLKIYYDQFVETSKLMGIHKCPLTFEELLADYKRCSKLGYLTSLSMRTFKLIEINDMGTDPAQTMETFNRLIGNWIARNPAKAYDIAKNLVILVQEFEDLQRK